MSKPEKGECLMSNKVVPNKRFGRNFIAVLLLVVMVLGLFGCTTGTKRDAGVVDNEAPSVPQNVNGIGRERACYITWSSNTEADLVGYRIYRSTNSGGPFTHLATVGTMAAPNYYDDDISSLISSVKSIMNYYNLTIPFYDYSMEEVIYQKK